MASCGKASFLLTILMESEIEEKMIDFEVEEKMIDFVNFHHFLCQKSQNIPLSTSSSWLLTLSWIQWAAVVV